MMLSNENIGGVMTKAERTKDRPSTFIKWTHVESMVLNTV